MRAWSLVPVALAILEVLHPTWTDGSVSEAVRAAGPVWVPLHVALLLGYLLLGAVLSRFARSRLARAVLVLFVVCNSIYLGVDGIAAGVLTQDADALWSAAWVSLLADATGATWAASLLLIADSWQPATGTRLIVGIVWLAFVASAVPIAAAPALLVSRIGALGAGFWTVYQNGGSGIPIALLIFASVLRQHVGAEAALGLLFVAIAIARSSPAAASLPSTD